MKCDKCCGTGQVPDPVPEWLRAVPEDLVTHFRRIRDERSFTNSLSYIEDDLRRAWAEWGASGLVAAFRAMVEERAKAAAQALWCDQTQGPPNEDSVDRAERIIAEVFLK